MLTAEFRHMDGIKGNFSIVDGKDYQATAAVNEGDPPNESVLSNLFQQGVNDIVICFYI
jgi:hypothetical protein